MKTRSVFFALLLTSLAFASLTSCSSKKKESADTASPAEQPSSPSVPDAGQPQFQVDQSFQGQLSRLFDSYLKLKDAFYSSDAATVKTEAKQTLAALEQVDMKLLSGAAHHDWMTYLTPVQTSLKVMQSENGLEAQRKAFSVLSDNLYKSIRAFGLGGRETYYDYCPMAFNNEGAYWLSDSKEIRNPYFGEKMPGCGQVKEKLN
ncbi:MAG TPA: DUF3347 domain-containing protein [Chryseosolibacter sp.]